MCHMESPGLSPSGKIFEKFKQNELGPSNTSQIVGAVPLLKAYKVIETGKSCGRKQGRGILIVTALGKNKPYCTWN